MLHVMLQQLQWLVQFVLPILVLVIVYFLGRIQPIGTMYAICLVLPGKFFLHLAKWLEPFSGEKKTKESEFPGLRTILLSIVLSLSLIAFSADMYNSLQALQSLWGDAASFTMPDLPPILTYSMALLYITVPAMFGMIWWEQRKVIVKEAKLFSDNDEFKTFIGRMFTLSVVASVAFYALRVAYLADSHSHITMLLQAGAFVLMGLLLPVIGAICVYIIALGLQAIASIALTGMWVLAHLFADVTRFLCLYFSDNEISPDDRIEGIKVLERKTGQVTITQEETQELIDGQKLDLAAIALLEEQKESVLPEPVKKESVLVHVFGRVWFEKRISVPIDKQDTLKVSDDTKAIPVQPIHKEEEDEEVKAAPSASLSKREPLEVPAQPVGAIAMEGNNAKNRPGRPKKQSN